MSSKNKNKIWIISSALLLAQLIFLYFIKYENQELPFTEFSLANTGNIFNLLCFILLIVGLFLVKWKGNKISNRIIFTFITLTFVLLTLSYIGTKVELPGTKTYILDQPVDKLISAAFFLVYFLILFMFISVLWISLLRKIRISFIQSFVNSILMLIIFLFLSYIYITTKTYQSEWILTKEKGNLAFVLGAAVWSENQPSPTLSSRVDRAIQLYNEGFVDKIFLTGSNAPGELAEAEVALNYAVSKGIDRDVFLLETLTSSTNQQILFLKDNLVQGKNINVIIIVSDSYHLPRIIEICRFYNVDIRVTASNHQLEFKAKLFNNLRESIAMFTFLCFAL